MEAQGTVFLLGARIPPWKEALLGEMYPTPIRSKSEDGLFLPVCRGRIC